MYYTMNQMADLFGVTGHTLRYYTDLGLLPCERDGGNRRIFNEESVNRMQGIMCLRGCGFSMSEIQTYCRLCMKETSEENLRARYQMILDARASAYKRLEEANMAVAAIERKVAHCEETLKGLAPNDDNPRSRESEGAERRE